MQKIISYLVAVIIGALIASFFFSSPSKDQVHHSHAENEESSHENLIKLTPDQIKKIGFTDQEAKLGLLTVTLSTRGKITLQPDGLAHIIPKAAGEARAAYKNIGDKVKAGEVMALLESRDIADLKAAYLASLSKERLAKSLLQREERLFNEKVSAGQDFLNAKNVHEEAAITVQLSRQKLKAFDLSEEDIQHLEQQAEPDLSFYPVRSPLDGSVILRHITLGEYVENTSTIYEVADLSTVWVEIGIYSKDLYQVKEGQKVEVLIPEQNRGIEGTLIYVSPLVAEETITAKAVAKLDNSNGMWRPGVFVKVNIATEKIEKAIVVSKESVQSSDGKSFVFIVNPYGFERRFVTLGLEDNTHVEILSGLAAGEKYVTSQTYLLKAELGKESAEHEH